MVIVASTHCRVAIIRLPSTTRVTTAELLTFMAACTIMSRLLPSPGIGFQVAGKLA